MFVLRLRLCTTYLSFRISVDCIPSHCSHHGVCDASGVCVCYPGFHGVDCASSDVNLTHCNRTCSGHGVLDVMTSLCDCDDNWLGDDCDIGIDDVLCVLATSPPD